MKTLIMLLGLMAIAGCCTKKGCEGATPEINIRLVENTNAWLNTKVYAINRNSGIIEDSSYTEDARYITISEMYYGFNNEIGAYDYIIATDSSSDTITNINYIISESKVLCNKCAFGDDYQTIKNYNNFSYRHEGTNYGLNDTLVINP